MTTPPAPNTGLAAAEETFATVNANISRPPVFKAANSVANLWLLTSAENWHTRNLSKKNGQQTKTANH
jgi:hypothetical protein